MLNIVIDDLLVNTGVVQTQLNTRKHVLGLANGFEDGAWRYSDFQDFIWDNIADTALSSRERRNLADATRSRLRACAKNLRLSDNGADPNQGSELAEVILYGVMRHHYGALPVVPKIFYKQNTQDYAKGADSVHIVVDGDCFSLWFGEAKFYNSIDDARLPSVIESVGNSLESKKLKKENSIITNVSDLYDLSIPDTLRQKIVSTLTSDMSLDDIKPLINIPILLLHECEITRNSSEYDEEYKESLREYHKDRARVYFSKQAKLLSNKIFKYADITFHIILIPVPSKEKVVEQFLIEANHYRG